MLGKSGRSTRAGELGDFSVFLFLWRIKGEKLGAKEGGKMEMVPSVGGSYEDPRVFAGPNLPH